jgi:hypothetical protein
MSHGQIKSENPAKHERRREPLECGIRFWKLGATHPPSLVVLLGHI